MKFIDEFKILNESDDTKASKKASKRDEFFWNLFVIAMEDPYSVFDIIKYEHYWDETETEPTVEINKAHATIRDEDGKTHQVTPKTIRDGILKLEKTNPGDESALGLHKTYRRNIHNAYRELESGDLDAYDAQCILQVGMYGEVIYG